MLCNIRSGQVLVEIRNIAPEFPHPVVVEYPQGDDLSFVIGTIGVGYIGCPVQIGYYVVATLHTAICTFPQTVDHIGGNGFKVHHQVPRLVVGFTVTTHPKVVCHDIAHQIDRIIFVECPVRPVQRVISSYYGFLNVFVSGEVSVYCFVRRR